MQVLLRKISEYIYRNESIVKKWRSERFNKFIELVGVPNDANIIDLGGNAYFWDLTNNNYTVTIVNLPGENPKDHSNTRIHYVDGDATDLSKLFKDKSFDIVFSNSVIEHVGNDTKVENFSKEVQRLGHAYWIQTPSGKFPIEPHTGFPFFWRIPKKIRAWLFDRWEKKLPEWTQSMRSTRLITLEHMINQFPEAEIFFEKKCLLEKSYTLYKKYSGHVLN